MCLFASQLTVASEPLWTELEANYQFRATHLDNTKTHTARKMHLNLDRMKQTLTAISRGDNRQHRVTLPSASGELIEFNAEATSTMSPELAMRYPQIQTWKITGIDNPEISGSIDIGPRGFHGLFHTIDGDRIFIDPEHQDGVVQTDTYTVLSSRTNHGSADSEFICQLHNQTTDSHLTALASKTLSNPSDDLRIYRLAMAVTGEYTQLFGGTKTFALAGVVTTVNRVNHVFERDLNIRLELVSQNDKLIFTSPSTDPYTNQDAAKMAEQNIISTNSLIGSAHYDIGHVLGTGRTGGLAFLSSTCGANKAGGVTGSNSPTGEVFNIDYVAHEIGHQLGAAHTFNGYVENCSANNRMQGSAVEPGSGSSIMGYAGICGEDNLQSNSDAFFHSHSIAQIRHFTQQAKGSQCGTLSASLNNRPEVDAGKNYSIPAQTPFVLTGYSNDIDGDPLLHSWEQTDTGTMSDLYSDLIDNPLFRLWTPTTNAQRHFPRLSDLLNNQSSLGELLPSTDRQLNFSLLVRDNKGGVATDSVALEVIDTGRAFAITSSTIPPVLTLRQPFNLTWDVADTDKAPIRCQSVDIGFIQADASYTPIMRATPNDGNETINLPLDIHQITNANLKIACSDNIFFAVSRSQHTVAGGDPVLSINAPSIAKNINGINSLVYTLTLSRTAPEEIFIRYEATGTVNKGSALSGEAVIAKSQTVTTIKIPVDAATVEAAISAISLTIKKPTNAQFEIAGSQLVLHASALAASPEITEVAENISNSGGGSLDGRFILTLLLLMLARISSMNYALTIKRPI